MPLDLAITSERAVPARVESDAVPFARHDPVLCSLSGLFRVVSERLRDQVRVSLQLKATHGKLTVELHNSSLLNGLDLAVLQALVALAAVGDTIEPSADDALTIDERSLVTGLVAPAENGYAQQPIAGDVQHINFSNTALLELIGWPVCGENRTLVQACLQRLATCVLLVYPTESPKSWQRFHLLSAISTHTNSDKWSRTHVALNPRLSQIVLGTEARYTRIALDETRKLGKDQAARILHQRLCSWINEGTVQPVSYGTLVGYLYPDDTESATLYARLQALNPKQEKQSKEKNKILRVREMQKAMNALAELPGWDVCLASDAPFLARNIEDENERALAEERHNRTCALQRRVAAADILKTVVHVRRGRLV